MPREWNPFANADWFVFALTINNSIWGLVSYFILNYCDALWLNLTFVLAMGLTWPAELLIKHLQLAESKFFQDLKVDVFRSPDVDDLQIRSIS